jgi:hypothetical protein
MSARTPESVVVADERSRGSRLENMSSRPTTVVTHAPRGARCQLVPSLRVKLDGRRAGAARRGGRPLAAIALPSAIEEATPDEQVRVVERLCRAVIEDLRLPGVIALAPGGKLPDETVCTEPLLALTVLTRRSGPVWLRDRTAALERLSDAHPVGLLLAPDNLRYVTERLATPGWATAMFSRAQGQEVWS